MTDPIDQQSQQNLINAVNKINPDLTSDVFHFEMNRTDAENYLKNNPGIPFIIRKASKNDFFALTYRSPKIPKHLLIGSLNEDYRIYTYADSLTDVGSLSDLIIKLIKSHIQTLAKQAWEQFKVQLPKPPSQKAVLSIQSLDGHKVALKPEQLEEFARKNYGLDSVGDGHTGFALAKTLHAPFAVVRTAGNREEVNAVLKDHIGDRGLLVITGHGSQDGDEITGIYQHATQNTMERVLNSQIERGPEDIVSSTLEAGLKSGDQITILLSICYGAVDRQKTGMSFAHKLAREFAKHGISTTIIASDKPVLRFGCNAIKAGQLTFDKNIGMAAEDICVFTTKVLSPDPDPTIDIYKPNETLALNADGLDFIGTEQPSLLKVTTPTLIQPTPSPVAHVESPIIKTEPQKPAPVLPLEPKSITKHTLIKPRVNTPETTSVTGSLSLNEALKSGENETAQQQAERIFANLRNQLALDPSKKIALLYAANNDQAQLFHHLYAQQQKKEILPSINGSGQAQLFRHLINLINKETQNHPDFSGKIRILPVATSIHGGENLPGNIVTGPMIQRDLKAIQKHLQKGYDVQGIPNIQQQYALGGGASRHWYTKEYSSITHDGKTLSQGDFVQNQLKRLEQNINSIIDVPQVKPGILKEELHYDHATLSTSRFHLFKAVPSSKISDKYKGLTGDALKTKILSDFKDSLEQITDPALLKDRIETFEKSDEYKILATSQGFISWLFNRKTDSITAYEKIINNIKQMFNSDLRFRN